MIYLDFFNLNKEPFSLTPDTDFFLNSDYFKDAFETLIIAINNGEGFIKVIGEVGTGKTLLCRRLLGYFSDNSITAYIPNPNISPKTLSIALARELNINFPLSSSEYTIQLLISKRLMDHYNSNKKVIVCIDEAQAMPDKTLEYLRLLTNLETEKSKLLQVILFGQPELDDKLRSRHLRQLRQRVSFSVKLKHLDFDILIDYLTHRLVTAGYTGGELFPLSTLKLLHRYSRGIPRLVNIITHKALILCYGKGQHQISKAIIKQAISDTEDAYIDKTKKTAIHSIIITMIIVFSAIAFSLWVFK